MCVCLCVCMCLCVKMCVCACKLLCVKARMILLGNACMNLQDEIVKMIVLIQATDLEVFFSTF